MRKLTRGAAALVLGSTITAAAAAQQPPVPPSATPPAPPAGVVPGAQPPAGLTPPTPTSPPKMGVRPQGVAATVTYGTNKQEIPEVAVHRSLRQFPAAHQEMARKEIVNHLIENTLVDQYLTALQVKVEPQAVDKMIGDLKKELQDAKKDYATELAVMLITEDELRAEVLAQLKWEAFVTQQATDEALKKLFAENPDVFDGTTVRARHILLNPGNEKARQEEAAGKLRGIKQAVEQEAAKAVAALPPTTEPLAKEQARTQKTVEVFSAYAKEYSVCPSKKDGGDLNFFPRAGAMVEPFAKVAFDLKVGQMSDVVATEFGYHLILITDRLQGKPRKFEDNGVKEEAKMLYMIRLREAVVAAMKPKAQITINPAPAPTATPAGAPPAPGAPPAVVPPGKM